MTADPAPVRVAVGVLVDAAGRVLVARRASGKPWAGYWEFPGGKQEAGESRLQALRRELREELGIEVSSAAPLIRLPPEPDDAPPVVLDVWRVTAYGGTPAGCEGQTCNGSRPMNWTDCPCRRPTASSVAPLICPTDISSPPDPMPLTRLIESLRRAIRSGIRLVQVRRPDATRAELAAVAEALRPTCVADQALLLLNGAPEDAQALGYDGVHLSGARLARLDKRPDAPAWIGASCHNPADLARARALALDFAVLSPVRATPGHARVTPLGWRRWAQQVRGAGLPVYALGGVAEADLHRARRLGGQGIAAIRGLWPACA